MTNWLRRSLLLSAAALLLPTSLHAADAPPAGEQQPQKFEKQIPVKLNYLLFLPEGYGKGQGKKFPLMLFLHGAGERGDDINKVKVHGPPKIVQNKKDFPFILVSPQCPNGRWWESYELIALLDEVTSKYDVDLDRVYVTGLSMGGFGTWDLALHQPNRFAAIAPICGGGDKQRVRMLKDLPIWVFHGEADPTVPIQRSEEMVDALKKVGGDVKFTRYPGVGHDSWTQTYNNPELYTWLLSHKRGEKKQSSENGK